MPECLNATVQSLTAEGVSEDVARRAAVVAFWAETGHMPTPDAGTDIDLTTRAREFVALAAAEEVARLQAGGLEDLATFAEQDAPEASGPRVLREAHLLHPGTFNGHQFSRADLQQVVDHFDPADPPPIQLDHSLSARDTQGYVRALRMEGDKLRALLEFRGQEAVTRVSDGLWRKLSAGVYLRPTKRLKEVSVTPFPAVAGPEPARVLTQGGNEMTKQTPAPVEDIAPETAPEAPAELAEVPTEESVQEPEKALADTSEADAIMAAHEAEIARLRAQLEQQEQVARLREDTGLVAEFVRSGRSTPAMSDVELRFVQTLSPEQRDAYVALKQASPGYVTMGRQSLPNIQQDGKSTPQQAQAQTEALLAEAGYRRGEDGRWTR